MFNTTTVSRMALVSLGALGLSGCYVNFDNSVSGVPLDELDMSGAAPVEIGHASADDLILTVGDELAITIDGDDSAKEELRFDLDGDSLSIGREGKWGGSDRATITVTMPAPKSISHFGSGSIEAETLASDAEISHAGSGRLTIKEIASDELEISLAGSGKIVGAGTAKRLDISSVGSGAIDFSKLEADRVEISSAGSGDVSLMSNGRVSASLVGSGDVTVTGDAECESSVVGSGSLDCKPA